MNPVEITIKISITAPEDVKIAKSISAPVPMEQLPAAAEAELPVPSEAAIEAGPAGEELPKPLSPQQLEAVASEEASGPDKMPRPVDVAELAAMTCEPPVEKPPEPEKLDTLAAEEEKE